MVLPPSLTLKEPLRLPVEVIKVEGLPKVMAGNLPVTPVNAILKAKREDRGTKASLETYAHAYRIYVEFATRRGRSLIDVTNEEFWLFRQLLKVGHFTKAVGEQPQLTGARGPRMADTVIALWYSMAADILDLYGIKFVWYRCDEVLNELFERACFQRWKSRAALFRNTHPVPYTPKKVLRRPG